MKIVIIDPSTDAPEFTCAGPGPYGVCSLAKAGGRPPCAGKHAVSRAADGSQYTWSVADDARACFVESLGFAGRAVS